MMIHITNLDQNLIEADLRRLFTPYGEIGAIHIDRDHNNNRPRGKAIIEMPIEKDAQNALLQLNGMLLGKKRIALLGIPGTDEPSLTGLR